MKHLLIGAVAALLFGSCHSVRYIPVERVKTEHHGYAARDSIFYYDSIFIKEKGDTLLLERYQYIYRDKIIRDSLFIQDTIRVPYPVEVIKSVKAPLTRWQTIQIGWGRIALGLVLLALVYIALKLKRKLPF